MASSNVSWGIDIGANAIKALKLERDGDALRVADFVVLPHKRVLSSPDLDESEAMRVALGSLMAEYGDQIRGTTVAIGVPGHSSFARFAKLPPVEPKGVANLVRFEAVQQIPFPIDEVEWDYQVFASDDTPDIEVGIFAVTREKVNERLHLYSEVDLRPDHITLSPVAVYNAIAYDLEFTENTPGTIILDIGTTATDLIIAEGGRVWVRTFPLGGHHFTETLAETFKLSYAKAEKLKREAETSKYKRHIFQALKPVFGDLVQDVQRSIAYYQDTHPGAKLERLIGLGSTFKLLGLRKLLSQQLKIEVFRFESFKRISVEGAGAADLESTSLNMVTAYGLSLQGLGLVPITANLMPVSVIREAMWKKKTAWFVAAASIGVIGAGTTFLRPFLDSQAYQSPEDTQTVRSVISDGQRLQREAREQLEGRVPTFNLVEVANLRDGIGLYYEVYDEIAAMRAFSERVLDGQPQRRPAGVPFAFDLAGVRTEYLPPGTAFTGGGGQAPPRDPYGGGRESYGSDPMGDPGVGDAGDTAAGSRGAIRVTVALDSAVDDGLIFVNESVLEWLRGRVANPDPGAPFRYVSVPRIEEVIQTTVTGEARPGVGAGSERPGAGAGAGTGPGGAGSPFVPPDRRTPGSRERSAPSSSPPPPPPSGGGLSGGGLGAGPPPESERDTRRPPGGLGGPGSSGGPGGRGEEVRTIDGMAPLPGLPKRFPDGTRVTRYTLSWILQLQDPQSGEAEQEQYDDMTDVTLPADVRGGEIAETASDREVTS